MGSGAHGAKVPCMFRATRARICGQPFFAPEANDATYRRFGVIANNGKLYVQYMDDGATNRYPADILTNLQTATWYVVRITVDDTARGFYVEAYQESSPSVRGSYSMRMPSGKSWRFHHWLYGGTVCIDSYREFTTTSMTWSPDQRQSYSYDALNRLTGVALLDGGQGYTGVYEYSANGDLKRKDDGVRVDIRFAGMLYYGHGGVPERTIGAALKADEPKGYGGSNPSSSANSEQ